MYDIEKILKKFEDDLNSKTIDEKAAYLKSFGFKILDKNENHTPIKGAS